MNLETFLTYGKIHKACENPAKHILNTSVCFFIHSLDKHLLSISDLPFCSLAFSIPATLAPLLLVEQSGHPPALKNVLYLILGREHY